MVKPFFSRLLVLCLLLLPLALSSQTPTTVYTATVSGTLSQPSGAGAGHSYVRFQLMNCGGNTGTIPGVTSIVSTFDVQTTVGAWSTPVYGNDVIGCGAAQPGATRWRITPYINGAAGTAVTYAIHSGTTFVVDGAPACSTPTSYSCATDYLPACAASAVTGFAKP
jgi:hypothetical protein